MSSPVWSPLYPFGKQLLLVLLLLLLLLPPSLLCRRRCRCILALAFFLRFAFWLFLHMRYAPRPAVVLPLAPSSSPSSAFAVSVSVGRLCCLVCITAGFVVVVSSPLLCILHKQPHLSLPPFLPIFSTCVANFLILLILSLVYLGIFLLFSRFFGDCLQSSSSAGPLSSASHPPLGEELMHLLSLASLCGTLALSVGRMRCIDCFCNV